jgi:antitoxin ParD1/3/4
MNISLTRELEQLVQKKIRTGMYLSASEVVREGLRLLEERDSMRRAQLMSMRKKIALGLAQLDRGEGVPGPKVFRELRQKGQRQARGRK